MHEACIQDARIAVDRRHVDEHHSAVPTRGDLAHAAQDLLELRQVGLRLGVVQPQMQRGLLQCQEVPHHLAPREDLADAAIGLRPPAGDLRARPAQHRRLGLGRSERRVARQRRPQPGHRALVGEVLPVVAGEEGDDRRPRLQLRPVAPERGEMDERTGAARPQPDRAVGQPRQLAEQRLAARQAHALHEGIAQHQSADGPVVGGVVVVEAVAVGPVGDRHAAPGAEQHVDMRRASQERRIQPAHAQRGVERLERVGRRQRRAEARVVALQPRVADRSKRCLQAAHGQDRLEGEERAQHRRRARSGDERLAGREPEGRGGERERDRARRQHVAREPRQVGRVVLGVHEGEAGDGREIGRRHQARGDGRQAAAADPGIAIGGRRAHGVRDARRARGVAPCHAFRSLGVTGPHPRKGSARVAASMDGRPRP